jgi:putative FmdB family regulatory protein
VTLCQTFEYPCEDCGNKFEKLVRRPGADEVLCPSCGKGGHLEQQLSTFAVHSSSHASFDSPNSPESKLQLFASFQRSLSPSIQSEKFIQSP